MLKTFAVALLFLTVAIALSAGPLASNAQAADAEKVGDAGEIYSWTAGC